MNALKNFRSLIWLTLATLVLLAAVVLLLPKVVAARNAEAMVAAAAICIGAGWLAMVPPVVAVASFPEYVAQAGVVSIGVRLLLTLSIGMGYLSWASPPRHAFMTALAVWYLALLAVETGVTAYLARRMWSASPSSG